MPSNRLGKVQKQISKKKGRNVVLHEGSRDIKRLQRASARDDKLNRLAAVREKQNRPHLLRVNFFRDAAIGTSKAFDLSQIQTLIEEFLRRDDEELAVLKAQRRPGRPPNPREDLLKQKQSGEQSEYTSGFWLPDLEDAGTVQILKSWGGQWNGLNTMKFVRISRDGVKKDSSFPPKGAS